MNDDGDCMFIHCICNKKRDILLAKRFRESKMNMKILELLTQYIDEGWFFHLLFISLKGLNCLMIFFRTSMLPNL